MKIEQLQWSAETGWVPGLEHSSIGESAQVVFLFGSASLMKASESFELCRRVYPNAHLLGCSTAGEILGTNLRRDTVAVTAVSFANTAVKVARVELRGQGNSLQPARNSSGSLDPNGLKHVFIISEVLQVDASDLVDGINRALPPGATLSGGFSADGDRQQVSHIWCNGAPEQSSVAALGFYGDHLRIGSAATGLWGQFGPIRNVTKSSGSVLYELDGRSALGLYKDYLGELASGLPASGLRFPVCLSVRETGHSVLRGLLSVDESTQSMRFAGNVPQGARVRMMMGSIERMIDDTLSAARQSTEPLGDQPAELAIIVSCNGRRLVLKQRVEEELEAVREVVGEQAVLTGFYSCGEVAPLAPGFPSELHNETLAVTTLAES